MLYTVHNNIVSYNTYNTYIFKKIEYHTMMFRDKEGYKFKLKILFIFLLLICSYIL